MRRFDVFSIGIGVFLAGGAIYFLLQTLGIDSIQAGIWTQAVLVVGLVGWVLTYLFRFATSNLTYNQQLRNYEEALVEKRWETMSAEEREAFLQEAQAQDATIGQTTASTITATAQTAVPPSVPPSTTPEA